MATQSSGPGGARSRETSIGIMSRSEQRAQNNLGVIQGYSPNGKAKKYRKENKVKIAEKKKQYYALNKEEIKNLDLIKQFAYLISEEKKGPMLRYIIKQNKIKQVLVFTSSVHRADAVAVKLNANGIDAYAVHSKKSQEARTEALSLFKSGKIRVLVATDLMARGIDIKFLPYVINYELPRSPKDYVHRIGRTGRAESSGEAISLVSPEEEHHFKVIQKKMGKIATLIDGNAIDLKGY